MSTKPLYTHFSKVIYFCGLLFALFIMHSCRKDNTAKPPQLDQAVAQAKSWYESAYPVSSGSPGKLTTQSAGSTFDISQFAKPDWSHSQKYKRYDKDVIEVPIDPGTKYNGSLKDPVTNKVLYNKDYSRSYFLLMNDGKKFTAFVMTVIADASYVQNDTSKLKHNTYKQNDPDFTGLVLYFTPKGKYVQGYAYKNGQPVVGTSHAAQGTQKTQSISDATLHPQDEVIICIDWYWQTYVDGVLVKEEYLYTTCTGGTSSSSGGGGATPPPPPCTTAPPTTVASVSGTKLTVNATHPIVNFLPPPTDPCAQNPSHLHDPDFGEDDPSKCLNCRIVESNFTDFLQYEQSQGNTVYYPYNTTLTYNGVDYPGTVTEVDDSSGNPVYSYFTPSGDSGLFQTGNEYKIGTSSASPTVVYGSISYFGTTMMNFTRPAGTGSGGRNANTGHATAVLIADPNNDDWSTEPDNVTLTDPNSATYSEYQQTTPWPSVAQIVPFAQFVPYRKHLVNGVMVGVNCLTLSKEQIAKIGYTCSGYLPASQTFQTYTSASGANVSRTKQAVTYVISALQAGIPVIAGVDAYPGSHNFDGITDHFISIDGMGTDNNGKYFHFVDNSTSDPSTGDYYNNRIYYNATTGIITGKCHTGYTNGTSGHDYIVTQIRKSIKATPLPQ